MRIPTDPLTANIRKKNLRSHSLHRLRHCVHRLVEMVGLDPLMQTLELSQQEVCFLGLSSAGNRTNISTSNQRYIAANAATNELPWSRFEA